MSSNPLMTGYGGGDLLLTGAAWPTVGSLPRPVCAGCPRWPGWPVAPVSDESALEVAGPQDALYKSTSYLYIRTKSHFPAHSTYVTKILSQFFQQSLRQTQKYCRQTDRQTNQGKNVTVLAEVTKSQLLLTVQETDG